MSKVKSKILHSIKLRVKNSFNQTITLDSCENETITTKVSLLKWFHLSGLKVFLTILLNFLVVVNLSAGTFTCFQSKYCKQQSDTSF